MSIIRDSAPESVVIDQSKYTRTRWIHLYSKDDEFKAESSQDDLLQFFEFGDSIHVLYELKHGQGDAPAYMLVKQELSDEVLLEINKWQ